METAIFPMTRADWDSVCEIYMEGLATGQASFEVTVPTWERWNVSHHQHSRLVAREGLNVIGWAALSPASDRECYSGVAEVSIYITDRCQGRGIGKRLLQELITSSEQNGIWMLFTSTFPENKASLRMQESCGFRQVGIREKIAMHNGKWRDSILSERRSKVVGVAKNAGPNA